MPRVFTSRIVTEDNALGGSKIEKSLRFNGDDTYLSITPSSASNRRTWTWSAWIKKSKNATVQDLFSAYDGSAYNIIRIGSDDQLNFQSNSAAIKETDAVLRDTNAWYHIVVAIDTTSGTAADRVIIYINGSRQSLATDNSVSQNTDYAFNTTNAHTIGVYANGSSYNFDGYMAEINFIDGYQYDASYFGFTDGQTGIWIPKRYEGTYGTNGFYLNFGNASSGDEYQKYTVPTTSFTNDSDTLLLINNNESNGSTTFTDSSSNGYSISGTGSIAHSTAQAKFGSSSILFDGTDDSLSVGGNGTLYSELTTSSNKTYEAFLYLNGDNSSYIMSSSSNQQYLGSLINPGSGKFGFNGNSASPYTSVEGFVPALDIPTGRWFHTFVQRNADGTMSVGFDGKILTDAVAEGVDVSASGTIGPLKIGSQHYYGGTNRSFYDGYMDEIRMSDTPRYSPLGGAGTVGQDYSGNNNNLTPKNFSLGGVVKDTPTNNFPTINPLAGYSANFVSASNGNLDFSMANNHWAISTFPIPASGKWYAECVFTDVQSGDVSVINPDMINDDSNSFDGRWNGISLKQSGAIRVDNSEVQSSLTAISNGAIVGVKIDRDAGTVAFTINGSANGTAVNISSMTDSSVLVVTNRRNSSSGSNPIGSQNYGQDSSFSNTKLPQGYKDDFGRGDFYYSVPSGYQALCSANLPPNVPSIIRPQRFFETVTYTGNGGTSQDISSLEFQPDLIWFKGRNHGGQNVWIDSVRGTNKNIKSDSNAAEGTTTAFLSSFNPNGFTVGQSGTTNGSSETNVAWCWKAGGAAVSNSDGTITTSISANQESGFSIVTYTGTGSAATIGHGLGKTPKLIIVKLRSGSQDWFVNNGMIFNEYGKYYKLSSSSGSDASDTNVFPNTAPTSTVFSVGTDSAVNSSSSTYVAYVWSEIPGFSQFGYWTGNGSTDGPYIHTGFTPRMIIYRKKSDENWHILDTKRDSANPNTLGLDPNLSNAEADDSNLSIDFLSDGFKVRSSHSTANTSDTQYFYYTWAEQPTGTIFGLDANAR